MARNRNKVEAANTQPAEVRALNFIADLSPRLRGLLCYLAVLAIAICCYVVRLSNPGALFWDENYHVTSAERYIEGVAHFEPHPPLGLMLIAAGEKLTGVNDGIDTHVLVRDKYINGNNMPKGFNYTGVRLMPSLFAALGALLFYALMFELTQNRLHALLLSSLYLFENAYVVHFRAVHLDAFQMFFFIGALWQFVRLWRRDLPYRLRDYAGLAVWAGLAMMSKMNAAILLALFPMLYFRDARHEWPTVPWQRVVHFTSRSGMAVITLAAVIFGTFTAHALLTRKLPEAGTAAADQDLVNMSPAYREYLEQRGALTPGMVWVISRDYYKFMDKDHKGVPKLDITKPGENGSHPLHWPVHDKTINYRWDSNDGKTAYVQLAGNQVSWYLGFAAVLLSLVLIVNHRVFAMPLRGSARTYQLIEAFTGLYAVFMLMHLWIIAQRVMYLYHYFMGLMISYVLIVLMWQYLCGLHAWLAARRTQVLLGTAAAIFASFMFFVPLSNHWPLSKVECERRNVLSVIVQCQ